MTASVHDTAVSTSIVRSDAATPIVTGDSHARFGNLLGSEWTKLRSVRSTIWALDPGSHHDRTIRASLLAVPRRTPVLAAKSLVLAVVVFVVAEIAAFPSFFIGAAIMNSRAPVSIGDPDVLRSVIGAGLYAPVLGVFAIAIGTFVRHTAGANTGIIGLFLVLPPLALLLPGTVGQHIHAYLPTVAGQGIAMTAQRSDDLLTAWQGVGVFGLWTAALLALDAYLLKRRDA